MIEPFGFFSIALGCGISEILGIRVNEVKGNRPVFPRSATQDVWATNVRAGKSKSVYGDAA